MSSSPDYHEPFAHLSKTRTDPPKLILNVIVFVKANKKVEVSTSDPKTYGTITHVRYSVGEDTGEPTDRFVYFGPYEITWDSNPHEVETSIQDGSVTHFAVNSSDRAEPV